MLTVVTDENAHADVSAGLDEIVREGARRMLAVAPEAEVAGYIEALAGELDEQGHRLVVRTATPSRAPSPPRRPAPLERNSIHTADVPRRIRSQRHSSHARPLR